MMTISSKGLALIESSEGCRLKSYQDTGGIWTVGYGHTQGVDCHTCKTADEAREDLCADLADAEAAVNRLVTVPLAQNQFDALVCFTFNVGAFALKSSLLLILLNAGDYEGAAGQFLRWVHIAHRVSAGLATRRKAERALFLEA